MCYSFLDQGCLPFDLGPPPPLLGLLEQCQVNGGVQDVWSTLAV